MVTQDTSAIKDLVYPKIAKSLSDSTGVRRYKQCVASSFERRPSIYSSIPNDRLYYGEEDSKLLYTSLKTSKGEIDEGLKKTFFWNMDYSPIAAKDATTVAALCAVRYFLVDSKDKDSAKNAELAAIYLAFSGKMYPSLHYNSFNFLATDSDEIMLYVLNNKMNAKFDIKVYQNIFGAIRSMCATWIAAYPDKFKEFSDDDVGYLIKQLRTRIASLLKNFATLYYDAYKDKNYITFDRDNLTDDNFRIADNDTAKGERAVENTMNYMNMRRADLATCKICADQNVKKEEIKDIFDSITGDPQNMETLRELMRNIVSDYMRHSTTKDVRDLSFISYTITSKPNAKDEYIVKIKELTTRLLETNSANYQKRKKRQPTMTSYHKSFLKYVAITISKANK